MNFLKIEKKKITNKWFLFCFQIKIKNIDILVYFLSKNQLVTWLAYY